MIYPQHGISKSAGKIKRVENLLSHTSNHTPYFMKLWDGANPLLGKIFYPIFTPYFIFFLIYSASK